MAGFFASGGPLTLASHRRQDTGLVPKCGACGLKQFCESPEMPVWGEGRRRVLLVGHSPDLTEDRQHRPFVGDDGRLLRKVLNRIDVDLDRDCWSTNALRCHPKTAKDIARLPTAKEVEHCRPYLLRAVRELQPDVIVLLGAEAVQSLIGWLWSEEVGPADRWAGYRIPSQKLNAWVCPAWHPSRMRLQEGKRDHDLVEKLFQEQLSAAFALDGRPWNPVPEYHRQVKVVVDTSEAADHIRQMTENATVPLAWDLETNMLKPDGSDAAIWTCAISDGEVSIAYPWHGPAVTATLDFLCSDVPKIAQNMKFENRWAKAVCKVWVRNWAWDTMLAAHVLDNRARTKGLGFQVFTRLGFDSWDQKIAPYLKSSGGGNVSNRIRDCPLPDLLTYNGLDSLLEHKIAVLQAKELGVEL